MKKLILTIAIGLLFVGSVAEAKLSIHNLPSDQYFTQCPTNSGVCTDPFTGNDVIFINTDIAPLGTPLYAFYLYHEICHHWVRPFYGEYQGEKEEQTCNDFAGYILTGTDKGQGLFQKMIIWGYAEEK